MMIIVFNMTFMLMGYRLGTVTSAAYNKYIAYAAIEQAGLAMESSSNIGISHALLDTARSTVIPIFSGTTMFNITGSSFAMTQIPTYDPVTHVQSGESLCISGSYPLSGSSGTIYDTTFVKVTGNSFAQYVFYSVNENSVQWISGETCWGRLHTQDYLYINGNPDFKGKVTTKKGLKITSGTPTFEKGETQADISVPSDLTQLKDLGQTALGGALYKGVDVYVQFITTGQIVVRAEATGSTPSSVWGYTSASPSGNVASTTIPHYQVFNNIAALTSSGVMLVQDGALHVKGTLNGQITLGCIDSQSGTPPVNSGKSSVWIDSSLVYNAAPPCYQTTTNVSDDLLGIVATNAINVSQYINHDNTKAQLSNVNINASMFSQTSGFTAENYSSRTAGTLHLVGGIQQQTRGAVGQGGKGFVKDYDWDLDLEKYQPKGYPKTPFVVQNWIDITKIPADFWYGL
jgi:cytoskeletal protein CcmA (bactofilin family)